jgi:acyl-CoA reductase-like NAD-dependent aldehyde dehydrogenase
MAVLFQRPTFALDVTREAAAAREAQADWAARPLKERLWILRSIRHRLSEKAGELARSVARQTGRSETEVLSSEILPLADACRFLEREAPRILATRRFGAEGRPAWLGKVDFEVRREPLGLVLILAPSNYPIFLPGVQALQAITAGNGVLWKPGRGGFAAARAFADVAALAGLDWQLIQVLPDTPEAGSAALAAEPDKVLLTGSAATGREVLAEAGRRLVPATAELSGCDALFVLPGADLERTAKAIRFGLSLNGGATCIAPRRIFVPRELSPELEKRVAELAEGLPAVRVDPRTAARAGTFLAEALAHGARLLAGERNPLADSFRPTVIARGFPWLRLFQEDLFAPVVSFMAVTDVEEALAAAARCPYALGAAIFGPEDDARVLAGRVSAGVVTINDLIVPTADPRLPFGGRGESGYGVTRGAEGLLDLTAVKVVSVRQGRWLPHLEERQPGDEELFRAWMAAAHGDGVRARARGAVRLVKAMVLWRKS